MQGGSGHWTAYYTSPQSFIKKRYLIPWPNNVGGCIELLLVGSLS